MSHTLRQYGRGGSKPSSSNPKSVDAPWLDDNPGPGPGPEANLAATPKSSVDVTASMGTGKLTAVTAWASMFKTPSASVGVKRPRSTLTLTAKPGLGVDHLDSEKNSAKTRPRGTPLAHSVVKSHQLVLDLGQRFVEHRPCEACGMVYGHGLADDEAAHSRWCQLSRALGSSGAGLGRSDGETPLLVLGAWRSAGVVVARHTLRPVVSAAPVEDIRRHFASEVMPPTHSLPELADSTRPTGAGDESPGASSPSVCDELVCVDSVSAVDSTVLSQQRAMDATASSMQASTHSGRIKCTRNQNGCARDPIPCSIVTIAAGSEGNCSSSAKDALISVVCRLLGSELGEASCPLRRARGVKSKVACDAGTGVDSVSSEAEHSSPSADVQYFIAIVPGDRVAGVLSTERVASAYRVRTGTHITGLVHSQDAHSRVEVAPEPSDAVSHDLSSIPRFSPGGTTTARSAASSDLSGTFDPPGTPRAFSIPQAIEAALDLSHSTRAVLGVAQVWVAPEFRRLGVARSLLDAARAHAIFGYSVPIEELAFSQTTAAGAHLAASYGGRPDFLVYL